MLVGSLFSGIGGFDLGLERAGMSIEWQVENNDYCRKVLQKHWPHVPCHYDITTINWDYIPRVDLVCGGFPCQPFSCAGKQQGKDDERYLWPEVVRCLAILRPTWFLGENVYGLLHLGIEQVCADLETIGYQVAVLGIPACAVDAPHIRKRVWIVAHCESSDDRGTFAGTGQRSVQQSGKCAVSSDVADAESDTEWWAWEAQGQQQGSIGGRGTQSGEGAVMADSLSKQSERGSDGIERRQRSESQTARDGWPRRGVENVGWPTEPAVGRVAYGVPDRVDRLKGLGNAIVPQIAEAFGKMIMQCQRGSHV